MMEGRFTLIPQPGLEKILELASHVASFKTIEMEVAFATFIHRAINPPAMFTGSYGDSLEGMSCNTGYDVGGK